MEFVCENIGVSAQRHLTFAGQDTLALAEEYGTPLYLMDEDRVRHNCRVYLEAFRAHFGPGSLPLYAAKAAAFKQLFRIAGEEGMGVDVVSPGEIQTALEAVRSGKCPVLTTRQKHTREVYVVAEEGADKAAIEEAIKTMPNYFDEYDTTVTFITMEEMKRDHSELPHGGFVIRTGVSGLSSEHTHTLEYRLTLDSNPEFTALVLVALARAVGKHAARGDYGCKTVFDLAPADLSPLSAEVLRAHML